MQWVLIALVIVLAAGGVFIYLRRRQSGDLPLPMDDEPVDYTSMEVVEEPQGLLDRINLLRERFDNMPLPGKIALFASPVLVIVLALLLVVAVPMLTPPPPTPPPPPLPDFAIQKADLVSATIIRVEATTELTNGTTVQFQLLEGDGGDNSGEPFPWYAAMEASTEVMTGVVEMRVNKVADAPVPSQDKTYTVRLNATAEDGREVVVTKVLDIPDPLRAAFYQLSPEQVGSNGAPAPAPTTDPGGDPPPEPGAPITATDTLTTPIEPEPPVVTGTLDIPTIDPPTAVTTPETTLEATLETTLETTAVITTVSPTPADGWVVTVAHGGNVRQAPVNGEPVGLVDPNEQVTLLQQSADGEWYQLQTSDGTVGWVNDSLLTIPDEIAAQVPVEGQTGPTTAATVPPQTTTAPTTPPPTGEPTTPPVTSPAPTTGPPGTTPAPTSTGLTASVFNGGNVRQTPGGEPVLDQINANETVQLLQKTADGTWYQIRNEREIVGWVYHTLLTIAPDVAAKVPVGQ